MLKIKDWANEQTKFGFVLNSSNFYNEKSRKFQDFFFKYYQIENFYELDRVKKILFKKAKESVIVTIFNNKKVENNIINYYPVDLELFSETFDLLIIKEDKKVELLQKDVLHKDLFLRDYLVGNEFDLTFIDTLQGKSRYFKDYILSDSYYGFAVGIRITGKDVLCPKLNINESYYTSLPRKTQIELINKYKKENTRKNWNNEFSIPFIDYNNIIPFQITGETYLRRKDIEDKKFRRNKKLDFFEGTKLLFRRIPLTINNKYFFSVYLSKGRESASDSVFIIRLNESINEYLVISILNSSLINYYLNIMGVKRFGSSYPKIDKLDIKKIPLPKVLDENIVSKISEISRQLTEGILQYKGKIKEELNNLIYDLYDLSYLERQRIKDFFSLKKEADSKDLEEYKIALYETLEMYFEIKPQIKFYRNQNLGFNLIVTAVYFNDSYKEMPSEEKVYKYKIHEILKETNEKFLAMREIVFTENCAYIIKDNQFKNWSETKGFEDGKFILKKKKLSY